MQLTIPPEIAAEIDREAQIRNLPPEEVAMAVLRTRFAVNGSANGLPEQAEAEEPTSGDDESKPRNLAEALGDFIGAISSSEYVEGGARMSEDTGKQFTDILMEKRRRGKL